MSAASSSASHRDGHGRMAPEIMLFDEVNVPRSDPELVGEVLDDHEAARTDGTTRIVSDARDGLARDVADQIVVMDAGQVVEHRGGGRKSCCGQEPAYGVFPVALHSTRVSAKA